MAKLTNFYLLIFLKLFHDFVNLFLIFKQKQINNYMGNSSKSSSSENHARFLQNYLEDQIQKKRNKLGFSGDLYEKRQCNYLCCNTVEISFTKPVIIFIFFIKISLFGLKKRLNGRENF